MKEFLLEIYGEEMPARMQKSSRVQWQDIFDTQCRAHRLPAQNIKSFITPYRLTLSADLPSHQEAETQNVRGPRIDAPQKVLDGFMKGHGLTSLDECQVQKIKDVAYYFIHHQSPVRASDDILPAMIASCLQKMRWQKSMRWGKGVFMWVRPIASILALFDGKPLRGGFSLGRAAHPPAWTNKNPDLPFANTTFIKAKKVTLRNRRDYHKKLEGAGIILETEQRMDIITKSLPAISPARARVMASLTERPVMLTGKMPDLAHHLPLAVVEAVCEDQIVLIPLKDKKNKLSGDFMVMTNNTSPQHKNDIIKGYETLLSARLNDAHFYIGQDRKKTLDGMKKDLGAMVFHQKLGTMQERCSRIESWVRLLAPRYELQADEVDKIVPLVTLAKADLASQMVFEYPSLEGVMGGYYAARESLPESHCVAIGEHLLPQTAHSPMPHSMMAHLISFADKMDMLASFFAIGHAPTGSKDPYALRRTAIAITRLALDERVNLSFADMSEAMEQLGVKKNVAVRVMDFLKERLEWYVLHHEGIGLDAVRAGLQAQEFFTRPLKSFLGHVRILDEFFSAPQGAQLVMLYKRIKNILPEDINEDMKKSAPVDVSLFGDEEVRLYEAWQDVKNKRDDDFKSSLLALTSLLVPLDDFFNGVKVLADDEKLRANRLALLAAIGDDIQCFFVL